MTEPRRSRKPSLRRDPENSGALLVLAGIAAAKGRLDDALGYAERAAIAAPGQVGALMMLAQAQMRVGRNAEARETLESILKRHPGHFSALDLLARAQGASRQFREAEQTVKDLEALVGDDAERRAAFTATQSWLALQQGRLAEAESLLASFARGRRSRPGHGPGGCQGAGGGRACG